MEAADELGLGLSPGFKFNPEDEELVEYFLLPRLLGQKLPLEGMIYEDDPLRAPPWKLLSDHGRKGEAFFFAAGHAIHGGSSRRQKRTCEGGGCWEGQGQKGRKDGNGDTNNKLRVVDSESCGAMEVEWKKYMLNFHIDGEEGSTGWVMHEYVVTAPACLVSPTSIRAYRIRLSGHGKKRKREAEDYCGGADEDANGAKTEESFAGGQPSANIPPFCSRANQIFVAH
ncbi:hypothetical protein BRADI_3g33680v3 [Brachypodium distachyon]|uniref:NAC domain-containing protein n=1 Tax=Brachypodium distachyon TaxID=15368 RepID=A0A2K2D0W2_BRADI|nr:hypothetical protein BRADI_3g33680v3 [Brachypodium distachyon]